MRLLLVRHGRTAHTGERLTGWLPGVGLSDAGREEVAELVERLEPVHIDAVYTSPIQRAVETAKPIARAKGLRLRVRESLGEVRYGDWSGKRFTELTRLKAWKAMQGSPSSMRFPNGETLREVQARAVDGVEELRAEHRKEVVAVATHSDVIRLLVAHYAGIHLDLYERLGIHPASVTVLSLGSRPGIVAVNSTGTLAGLVPPRRRGRR